MNQEYQEKIDQYLLGQMSDQDCLVFENEIDNNQELKKQFEFTKNVKDAIVGRNRRLSQIYEWEQDYEAKKKAKAEQEEYHAARNGYDNVESASGNVEKKSSRRQYIYWISGIAAIFIVGFFLFSPTFFHNEGTSKIPIPASHGNFRSSIDDSAIDDAMNDGDFALALTRIEEKEQTLEIENTQMEKNRDNMDNEEYLYQKKVFKIQKDELKFMKVYALIGLKRTDEALVILDEMRNKEGYYQMQADSLFNLYK